MHKGAESGYATDDGQLEREAASVNPGFQWDPVVAKRVALRGKCLLRLGGEKWSGKGK